MNCPDLSRINDTDFASECSSGLPIYAVGFADRRHPAYHRFVLILRTLACTFGSRGVTVRLLDTDEHPDLARRLSLGNTPTLIVYSFGQRFARWTGRIDLQVPRLLLEALVDAYKDNPGT